MEMNVALVGIGLLMTILLAIGFYLEGHQNSSRAVPVIRPVYRGDRHRPRW